MKRTMGLALALLLMAVAMPLALSEQEAPDLSAEVSFKVFANGWMAERLTDRDHATLWWGENGGNRMEITSPEPIHGLYICWRDEPPAFTLEAKDGAGWREVARYPAGDKVHVLYPVPGEKHVRICAEQRNSKRFAMSEIYVLGEGTTPSWVQQWQDTLSKAELLVLFAHPDDEVLWFGGTIPYYDGQMGRDVVAVVMTTPTSLRRTELLNSLWKLGMRHYPVIGPFYDAFSAKLATAYRRAKEKQVNAFLTETFRRYKPKVVVTHDLNGEYGHGMHMLCADAALKNADYAANPQRHAASFKVYGTWQVSKVYLHLYPDNSFDMDWDLPLPAFGGRTGFEVAVEAYGQHKSQHRITDYYVKPRSHEHSSYRFGLAYTRVGPDILKNDFFENIPQNHAKGGIHAGKLLPVPGVGDADIIRALRQRAHQ